jgi:hypothetical protein
MTTVYRDRGYETRDYGGQEFLSRGGDNEIDVSGDSATVRLLSSFNRVVIYDDVLVRGRNDAAIQAVIDADEDDSESALSDESLVGMLDALDGFLGAYSPSEEFDLTEEHALLTGGGGFVPADQVDAKRREIAEKYPHWQRLPRFDDAIFAFDRTDDGRNIMKIALLYGEESEAQDAARELKSRLQGYELPLTRQTIFADAEIIWRVDPAGGGAVAIIEVESEDATKWFDIIFRRDTMFLVEELPRP